MIAFVHNDVSEKEDEYMSRGSVTFSVVVLIQTSFIAGCATPYQKVGFTGGYSETRLGEHLFRVNFRGNGYTSSERAADFCMLRCAELTQENGCRYFCVLQGGNDVSYSAYTTPRTSQTFGSATAYGNTAYGTATTYTYGGDTYLIAKPRSTLLVRCSPEKPDDTRGALCFDAAFLASSIRSKYRLKRKQ